MRPTALTLLLFGVATLLCAAGAASAFS